MTRKREIQGRAASPSRLLSTVAPAKAPTPPGRASQRTAFQSVLPSFQCAAPEARVVPTSARWTLAEATAGANPAASRSVVEVSP
jgi:hypothetical protein